MFFFCFALQLYRLYRLRPFSAEYSIVANLDTCRDKVSSAIPFDMKPILVVFWLSDPCSHTHTAQYIPIAALSQLTHSTKGKDDDITMTSFPAGSRWKNLGLDSFF